MKLSTTITHPIKGLIDIQELDESEAFLILSLMPALGAIKIRLLVQYFGSPTRALLAEKEELQGIPGFGPKIVEGLAKWREDVQWKQNLAIATQHNVHIIPYTNPLYPKRLLEIADHPVLLYMKGDWQLCDQKCIAIVGTRQASIYGYEMAQRFGMELASYGFTVVSGLARGIDTGAHLGALERGRTIAVIGSGLADIYPAENKPLADRIAQKGIVMSEFPMETPPDRQNFPQRNRIVSGMTLGTILIEAPYKSGAMITMEKGLAQGRKLFALPGRADHDNFRGNHELIKSGRAQLVESAEDVVRSFEDLFCGLRAAKPGTVVPKIHLEKEEEELIKILPEQETSFEEIIQLTKLPVMKLNVLLMSLVLKKAIKEFPGKLYKKGAYL